MSNELEFFLDSLDAASLMDNGLPVVHEVNPQQLVELNVSCCEDITTLNTRLDELVASLCSSVKSQGGRLYGGSCLIDDTDGLEPMRYRTTSLSESLAQGFMGIASQQMVLGVQGEEFGIRLNNFLRSINPVLLSLSSSSPYNYANGNLKNVDFESSRLSKYLNSMAYFPESILRSPRLQSLDHYYDVLEGVSNEVLDYLDRGLLDANHEELYRQREGGAHAPFDMLEPHQVYWMTRLRPDHRNSVSDFSIECRVFDMPTNTERMKMLNSFLAGLVYNAADTGEVPEVNTYDEIGALKNAARTPVTSNGNFGLFRSLFDMSLEGLKHRGYFSEYRMLENNLNRFQRGGASQLGGFKEPYSLKSYLCRRLENDLHY